MPDDLPAVVDRGGKAGGMSAPILLADLRCKVCGAAEPEAISPGQSAEMAADLFAVSRSVPARAWCLSCALAIGWPWRSEGFGRGGNAGA